MDRKTVGLHRPVLAGLAVVALAAGPVGVARADFSTDSSVTEVTGMASDTTRQVYWIADRTTPRITAVGPDGKTQGHVRYAGKPVDVEALSMRDGRVWIGDIGDPDQKRSSVNVYRIGDLGYGSTAAHRHYTLTYPDGARDAGALMVSPKGRLYLVTRGAEPGIYRAPAQLASGGTPNQLTRVADAPANVTDASFTADGTRMVLRTLSGVHVYDPYELSETAAAAVAAKDQGYALAPALSGTGLVLSGLQKPVSFSRVPLPTTPLALPDAPATPTTGQTSASPSATVSAKADEGTGAAAQNKGTLWALAAAALISIASGAVVALKR